MAALSVDIKTAYAKMQRAITFPQNTASEAQLRAALQATGFTDKIIEATIADLQTADIWSNKLPGAQVETTH